MNLTDDFRNTLYEMLDDMSVGNIQFGVLKTFYENDVYKLYDELIDTFPDDKMKKLETALPGIGSKMFLYYLYTYKNKVNLCHSPTEDKECINLAYLFNNCIQLAVSDKLQKLSFFETSLMRFLNKYELDELKESQATD